jgi:UDPglucose 6-dehydrogenase
MNKITVVGIGRLGLGLALLMEKNGYDIMGIDISADHVKKINDKTLNSSEPQYNELLRRSTNLRASTSLKIGLNHSDIIFIVVQTPNSGGHRFYDHSILSNLLCSINEEKVHNKEIIIGCTIMPTYIDQVGRYLLSQCTNCHLSYNPEFIAQGSIIKDFQNPDMVLIGTESDNLKNRIKTIYLDMCSNIPVFKFTTPLEAEIIKIGLNSFVTTKISFANMVADLCDEMGANKNTVLDAIGSDSRIGNKYFKAGFSFGGPCFPRDSIAFQQVFEKYNIPNDMLKSVTMHNNAHSIYQANRLLKENLSEYTFENVAYKDNCKLPIIEESPKLKIAKFLVARNKKVIITDIAPIILEVQKEYGNIFTYKVIQ